MFACRRGLRKANMLIQLIFLLTSLLLDNTSQPCYICLILVWFDLYSAAEYFVKNDILMHATIYLTCLNFSAYIIASLPKLLLNWCLCSSTLREINDFYASYKEWNIQTWHSTSQLHKSINVWAWRHGGEQKDFCEKWSRAKRFLAIWYRIIFRWEENCKINLNFQKRFCSFINSKEWNMQI